VLDLDPIAEDDALVDEDVPADHAIDPDPDACLEPASVADRGAGSDVDVRRKVGRRIDARCLVCHGGRRLRMGRVGSVRAARV
jgi:hypothetical protein